MAMANNRTRSRKTKKPKHILEDGFLANVAKQPWEAFNIGTLKCLKNSAG